MGNRKASSTQSVNRRQLLAVCPIIVCYDLIAGRWKTHVLWALRLRPLAFGALRRQIPAATERMVARRLVELQQSGAVEATGRGRTRRYRLSALGKRLLPLLQNMGELGQEIKRTPRWVPAESLESVG